MDHADYADRMLMNFGDLGEAFQETVSMNIDGKTYYGKKIISEENAKSSFDMWNTLYNRDNGLLLKINETPLMIDKYLFFPELGNEVTENRKNACKIAQEKLVNIGYFHTDLYYDKTGYYNYTNVREVNEDYYPIDFFKIVKIDSRGGKRKKTRKNKKGKKIKKRKKTKRKKTKRKKINDL
jgi:hypothetical protein